MRYLLILFFVNIIFSQSNSCGTVKYKQEFLSAEGLFGIYDMFFSVNESFFVENQEESSKPITIINGEVIDSSKKILSKYGQPLFSKSAVQRVYNYKTRQEHITFQDKLANEKIITTDNFKIEWNISEQEQKEIGGFVCKKATTTFRGVDYIAWFTEEIPLPYGPWKFRGLNGLILEVYDKNFNYKIVAVKITLREDCKEINKEMLKYDLSDTITWEKYLKLYKNEERDLQNKIKANTPRGSNTGGTTLIRGFQREIFD